MFDDLPGGFINNSFFLIKLIADPYIATSFICALLAALFWMAAMTKSDLSYAYPFVGLTFILILISSSYVLGETDSLRQIIGLFFILIGLYISSGRISFG